MPDSSVVLHSRMQVKTECERLDSLFIMVSPILRFSWPRSSSAATSPTAQGTTALGGSTKNGRGSVEANRLYAEDAAERQRLTSKARLFSKCV